MTLHSTDPFLAVSEDAGRRIAQLRHVLELVRQLAQGSAPAAIADAALDESARFASAYANALPVVQRRFDALAAETATWAAAGVEALLAAGDAPAAAAQLATEIDRALRELRAVLRA